MDSPFAHSSVNRGGPPCSAPRGKGSRDFTFCGKPVFTVGRPGTVTVPLRSHRNVGLFWIIFLPVAEQKDQ
jgi:hypothetical protein